MVESTNKYKNIMITTDFSELSNHAVEHALMLVKKLNSKLYVLHVVEPIEHSYDYQWAEVPPIEVDTKRSESAQERLIEWCDNQIPEEIASRIIVKNGKAVSEILDTVEEFNIDLIVMATHGLTGLSHLFFGSTTERIVKKSKVPVLTVR
jgi:nucleotide-binding universal stress UspA family protein